MLGGGGRRPSCQSAAVGHSEGAGDGWELRGIQQCRGAGVKREWKGVTMGGLKAMVLLGLAVGVLGKPKVGQCSTFLDRSYISCLHFAFSLSIPQHGELLHEH